MCPEDCGYCSQSKVSEAEIPRYNMLNAQKLLDGRRVAAERQAKTYCIVISARGPSQREMDAITTIVPQIKAQYDLKICACLGLLTPEQAARLKACGVDRVNHNLNTSEEFYGEICTTHTYADRVATLERCATPAWNSAPAASSAWANRMPTWCEWPLRCAIWASSRSRSISSTRSTARRWPARGNLNPRYCLKVLAMFRFANPDRELRIAGGRELHLGSLQALGLYPANSIFVGDYLTTKGQAPAADYKMIEDLGFEVAHNEEPGCQLGRGRREPDRPRRRAVFARSRTGPGTCAGRCVRSRLPARPRSTRSCRWSPALRIACPP